MSTERNFWTFAFEHPFLTFFAFDIAVTGIVNLFRGRSDSRITESINEATNVVKTVRDKLKSYNEERKE